MQGTFKILLHKSLWYRRSTSSYRNDNTKTFSTQLSPSQNSDAMLPKKRNGANIIRISKYNLTTRRATNVRPPNNSPKRRASERRQKQPYRSDKFPVKSSSLYKSKDERLYENLMKDEEYVKYI